MAEGDETNPLDSYSPFDGTKDESVKSPTIGADPEEEDEIRAFEQRLNILEAQLASQESELVTARETGSLEPPANWPNFYPLVHFDIEEVPTQLRSFVTDAMFEWCAMSIAFGLNFIGCLTLLRAGDATDSPGSKIALSTLYLFLLVPLALDLIALAVYRILKSDSPSSLSYLKLFLFMGGTTFFQAILTLGLESSGSCGLITMLSLWFGGHFFIATLAVLVTGSLAFSTFLHFRLLSGLWSYYRGTADGGDLEQTVKRTFAGAVVDALKA
jgi:hypothetical protein